MKPILRGNVCRANGIAQFITIGYSSLAVVPHRCLQADTGSATRSRSRHAMAKISHRRSTTPHPPPDGRPSGPLPECGNV